MKFKASVVVTGLKRSKGDMEGTPYDFTSVFIQVDLDESTKNARGQAVEPYKLGTSDNYATFDGVQLPFNAMAEFEITTTGKVAKQKLLSLVPVPARP
jgi:hypothetical protein